MDGISPGVLAQAHHVRGLYRRTFTNRAKRLAIRRSIEALKAAGCTFVLDLWGGGLSAEMLHAAGIRVLSVENGSMEVLDNAGRKVSAERKRRALEISGLEGGYETFWGTVQQALAAYPDIDGALLDFHGPWSSGKRDAVSACRPLAACVITLMPDHDMTTHASSAFEREMAYQLFLKLAWADRPRWEAVTAGGHVRRLINYHNEAGKLIYVYLLARRHVVLPRLNAWDRITMRNDRLERSRAHSRAHYHRLGAIGRARWNARTRHAEHVRSGRPPRKPCQICGMARTPDACKICGSALVYADRGGGNKKFCGPVCYRINKTDKQRSRRMAAVSGTAAEAIKAA